MNNVKEDSVLYLLLEYLSEFEVLEKHIKVPDKNLVEVMKKKKDILYENFLHIINKIQDLGNYRHNKQVISIKKFPNEIVRVIGEYYFLDVTSVGESPEYSCIRNEYKFDFNFLNRSLESILDEYDKNLKIKNNKDKEEKREKEFKQKRQEIISELSL